MSPTPVDLEGPMNVRLKDGSVYQIRPGPYGRGVSLHAVSTSQKGRSRSAPSGEGTGQRGRPPSPSTLALRDLLMSHATKGELKEARFYHSWLTDKNPSLSSHTARQTVYREHRAVVEANPGVTIHKIEGKRRSPRKNAPKGKKAPGSGAGRPPSPATALIRERLSKDAAAGKLEDAKAYTRWLVHEADIGMKKARPIVYRELRTVQS